MVEKAIMVAIGLSWWVNLKHVILFCGNVSQHFYGQSNSSSSSATNFLTFLTRRVTNSIHLLNKCIQRAVNKLSLMWLDTSRTRRIIYWMGLLLVHYLQSSFLKDSKWMLHLKYFLNWYREMKNFMKMFLMTEKYTN